MSQPLLRPCAQNEAGVARCVSSRDPRQGTISQPDGDGNPAHGAPTSAWSLENRLSRDAFAHRPTVVSPSPSVREGPRLDPDSAANFRFLTRHSGPTGLAGIRLSHLANAMSLTFPEGERFFIDSVRRYEERVDSPALRQDIARFHGQEALHSRAHEALLQSVARDNRARRCRGRGVVRQGLDEVRRNRSPRYQLAMTCALEHFTAMMAELLLSTDEMRDAMAPEVRRLLVWHAIEEIEHKAVAFDTFVATGGTYGTRVLAMLVTTFGFTASVAAIQLALMRQDPARQGPPTQAAWTAQFGCRRLFSAAHPRSTSTILPGLPPMGPRTACAHRRLQARSRELGRARVGAGESPAPNVAPVRGARSASRRMGARGQSPQKPTVCETPLVTPGFRNRRCRQRRRSPRAFSTRCSRPALQYLGDFAGGGGRRSSCPRIWPSSPLWCRRRSLAVTRCRGGCPTRGAEVASPAGGPSRCARRRGWGG